MSDLLMSLLKRTSDFVSSGDDDLNPRVAVLYTIIAVVSINLSSYSLSVMSLIILTSGIYSIRSSRRFISGIVVALPFTVFFSVSTLLLTSSIVSAVRNAVFIISLISLSSIMLNIPHLSILSALRDLKLPERISVMIIIAFRLIYLCSNDLINILQLYSTEKLKKMEYYRKILRAFLSVLTLRAISLSETIYIRGEKFFEVDPYAPNKFGEKEAYFTLSSFFILAFSIAVRLGAFGLEMSKTAVM
jgi:hypothetical protein